MILLNHPEIHNSFDLTDELTLKRQLISELTFWSSTRAERLALSPSAMLITTPTVVHPCTPPEGRTNGYI